VINQKYHPSQAGDLKKWQAHLAAQAKSGLSRSEYCRRQQISYHAFVYWRKRLSKTVGDNVALVPITLQTGPERGVGHGSVRRSDSCLAGEDNNWCWRQLFRGNIE